MNITKGFLKSAFVLFSAFLFVINSAAIATAANDKASGEPLKPTNFLTLEQGQKATFKAEFKNTGNTTWLKGKVSLQTGDFLRSFSQLESPSWQKYYLPVALDKNIAPKQTVSLAFTVVAPTGVIGDIQQNFLLVDSNDQPIKGTTVRLFVAVKKSAQVSANGLSAAAQAAKLAQAAKMQVSLSQPSPTTTNTSTVINTVSNNSAFLCSATGVLTSEQIAQYASCNTALRETDTTNGQSPINMGDKTEPQVRVGLFSTIFAQRLQYSAPVDVYAGSELIFSGLNLGETITLGFDFNTKLYNVKVGNLIRYNQKPLRVIPRIKNSVATLLDFRSTPTGSGTAGDNRFRNIIEMQYSTKTCKLWIINELPLGYYLKGLGETSNYSPIEFQKVMLSAARTYAMYHYNRGIDFLVKDGSTKHGDEHFHLDATYDQVYRGYNSELRMPNLVAAENQTRGLIITYQGKVAITPYFSRSDGRTRSWVEVWGGAGMPWLQSVAVPGDAGQTLWGHGVGMSARGALLMVINEKKSWDTVIKYFYQGVDVTKVY